MCIKFLPVMSISRATQNKMYFMAAQTYSNVFALSA